LVFAILISISSAYGQNNLSYIESNLVPIQSFDSLDNHFENTVDFKHCNNKLYLLGEEHSQDYEDLLEITLFKYLYLNNSVRVLLIERSIVDEYLLQSKLDEKKEIYDFFLSFSKYYCDSLKDFYKNLPEHDKFIIRGIDVIYDFESAFKVGLSIINQSGNVPARINRDFRQYISCLERIKEKDIQYQNIIRILNDLKHEIINNDLLYKDFLGSNYAFLLRLIDSMLQSCKLNADFPTAEQNSFSNPEWVLARENILYKNMMIIAAEDTKLKFFGQFGSMHVSKDFQKEWFLTTNWNSFACKLNTETSSPFYHNICSGMIYYPKTKYPYNIVDSTANQLLVTKYNSKLSILPIHCKTPLRFNCTTIDYLIINNSEVQNGIVPNQ